MSGGLCYSIPKQAKEGFFKRGKQALDAVMLHWWTHSYELDQNLWEEYIAQLEANDYQLGKLTSAPNFTLLRE